MNFALDAYLCEKQPGDYRYAGWGWVHEFPSGTGTSLQSRSAIDTIAEASADVETDRALLVAEGEAASAVQHATEMERWLESIACAPTELRASWWRRLYQKLHSWLWLDT